MQRSFYWGVFNYSFPSLLSSVFFSSSSSALLQLFVSFPFHANAQTKTKDSITCSSRLAKYPTQCIYLYSKYNIRKGLLLPYQQYKRKIKRLCASILRRRAGNQGYVCAETTKTISTKKALQICLIPTSHQESSS